MRKIDPIEPKILPLVEAINSSGIVKTFSSCQGHYDEIDQETMDRNHADVRFDPLPNILDIEVERFITFMVTEFNNDFTFVPTLLRGYKLFTPNNKYETDAVYVIELTPFERMDNPKIKRKDTDEGILNAVTIVQKFKKMFPK